VDTREERRVPYGITGAEAFMLGFDVGNDSGKYNVEPGYIHCI
jgi:hypothetical protein